MKQTSLPPGFRDLTPTAFLAHNYITDHLKQAFTLHGFLPLETPAIEHLSTLMHKSGEESDQLLFKILNSGNFLSELSSADLTDSPEKVLSKVSKKALRYDLTVPLARYVRDHKQELHFPFKRYQIQPVWRADRPQKGRYREFYQCDVDIVGTTALFHEASLLAMAHTLLTELGIPKLTIYLNDRRLLSAIAHYVGAASFELAFCQTLDKIDKIGKEAVLETLRHQGLTPEGAARLAPFFEGKRDALAEIARLRPYATTPLSSEALNDLTTLCDYLKQLAPMAHQDLRLDSALARGMSYYTGAIFEIKAAGAAGSIVGGGRYDRLLETFSGESLPSVGLSFGLARIHDIMHDQQLFPSHLTNSTQLLLVPMEAAMEAKAIRYLTALHKEAIPTELYPAGHRMKKVFAYANKKKIPWVGVIGSEELATGTITIKNMRLSSQKKCKFALFLAELSQELNM